MGPYTFECSDCTFVTNLRMDAAKHRTSTQHTYKGTYPALPQVFLCRDCDKPFSMKLSAQRHVDIKGHLVIDSVGDKVDPTPSRFACGVCSFIAGNINDAQAHVAALGHQVVDNRGLTVQSPTAAAAPSVPPPPSIGQTVHDHVVYGGTQLTWPHNDPPLNWSELTHGMVGLVREAVEKRGHVAVCFACGARFTMIKGATSHHKVHGYNHVPMWNAKLRLATHKCDGCNALFDSQYAAIEHCTRLGGAHLWATLDYALPITPDQEERVADMFETIVRLYTTAMITGVTSPTPHIVGPPGCGKSSVAQQVADLAGVTLHTINVSRLSPLDLEGVQMPDKQHSALKMLTATFWTQLREGDIVLFDEFLRGFPEVYNGLLDIFTSRQVGAFKLPRVFIMAASNSVATYDPALEDRLMHILVPDPRHNSTARNDLAQRIIDGIGLIPDVLHSSSMQDLLADVVLPTFDVLDSFKGIGGTKQPVSGSSRPRTMSIRKLIGMARLRQVDCAQLAELIDTSNRRAVAESKPQYIVLTEGKSVPTLWISKMESVRNSPKLTPLQRENLELNFSLIEVEESKVVKGKDHNDDDVTTDDD